MSSLTNFLKLFKWDTKTDGSQKFNIDKCINGNWDKLDTYLENLEIGGRNLLKSSNSFFLTGSDQPSNTNRFTDEGKVVVTETRCQ